jgi:hypothetical protein
MRIDVDLALEFLRRFDIFVVRVVDIFYFQSPFS